MTATLIPTPQAGVLQKEVGETSMIRGFWQWVRSRIQSGE